MGLLNRKQLKDLFKNGSMPTAGSFAQLIDSVANKVDDGLLAAEQAPPKEEAPAPPPPAPEPPPADMTPAAEDPAKKEAAEPAPPPPPPPPPQDLIPRKGSTSWLALYGSEAQREAKNPLWQVDQVKGPVGGQVGLAVKGQDGKTALSVHNQAGKIRVGVNKSSPQRTLDVAGAVGMMARVGTFADPKIDPKTILADGKWHPILSGLKGIQAVEVLAVALSKAFPGRYGILQATAIAAGAPQQGVVNQITSSSGRKGDQLILRWAPDPAGQGLYSLQITVRKPYPDPTVIQCRITALGGFKQPAG